MALPDYKGTKVEVKWERIGVIPKAFKFGPEPQQDAVPNAQQQEGQQQQDAGNVEQDENVRRNTVERTGVHTRSQREEAHAPDTSSVKKHIRELRALGVPIPVNENQGNCSEL